MSKLRESLHETFGIESLRSGQDDVIKSVLEGTDTLAIMPTGAGKSLCYQLPALHLEGTTIIVSPLISLMKDQVDKLQEHGLDALQVNSALPATEQRSALGQIRDEKSDFVFTTPERLSDPEFLATLRGTRIDFVVIDEAHCISHWGHDFRPAYLAIRSALEELNDPPVLALTATATENVVDDIKQQLGRPNMKVYNTGIFRPTLQFEVEHVNGDGEKQGELLRLLETSQGDGIIYAATVKHVEEITTFLQQEGFEVLAYHGRLNAQRRKEAQDRFMAGELDAIVATNAFGMGIDRPDIRSVLHYDLPASLEAYYQEAGRAGRDGEPARCVLLYDGGDRRIHLFMMGGRYPASEHLAQVYRGLSEVEIGPRGLSTRELEGHLPGVPRTKVRVTLGVLKEEGIVEEVRAGRWSLRDGDVPEDRLEELAQQWKDRSASDQEKLRRMESYARSARCRWLLLHEYFAEEMPQDRCETCDNCRKGLAQLAEHATAGVEEKPADNKIADTEAKLNIGDQVSLPRYGSGRVEEIDDDALVVSFPDGKNRKFKREFARAITPSRQKM